MDLLSQSALILSVTALSLAISVLARNFRNRLGQVFALLCMVVWAWSFFFFLEKIFVNGNFYRLHLAFHLALPIAALYFLKTLTRVEDRTSRHLFQLSLGFSALLVPLQWTRWADITFVRVLTYAAPLTLAIECAHLMYLDFVVARGGTGGRQSNKSSTVGLNRKGWIYFGALAVMGSCFMDHLPVLGDALPSLGNLLFSLYLFLISEAVTQQRLLNLGALLRRVLSLVTLSLAFTVVYTLLVAWIHNAPGLFLMNSFLASFIVLLLMEPFRKLTQYVVRQIFYGPYNKIEEQVSKGQAQLTGVIDQMGLSQVALQFLSDTLQCESASFFILRSDGTKYRRLRGYQDERLSTREILVTQPFIDFFLRMNRRGETPVILDNYLENEIDRTTSIQQRQQYEIMLLALKNLQSNVLIPLIADQSVLGFAAVRASSPPEPWGSNWGILSILYPFFAQAARILKNMDVYVRLREKDRLAALGEMSAGLAHEIRNPLGAIKGAAQLLEQNYDMQGHSSSSATTKDDTFIRIIVEETNRLNKVVTQFLDYARPNTTDHQYYSIHSLLQKCVDLIKLQSLEPVFLKEQFQEGLSKEGFGKLKCNPEQIKQVLMNFMQNAVRSVKQRIQERGGEPGVVEIGVRWLRNQEEIELYVEDNGVGIPKENLERIFIPFFTTAPSGTGLGLPICSRIVEAHGGRIEVQSEESKYARFSVLFPKGLIQQ